MNPPPLTTLFEAPGEAIPLHLVAERDYAAWMSAQSAATRLWLQRSAFRPEQGKWILLPGADGEPSAVLVGTGRTLESQPLFWLAAALADRLPPGAYALATEFGAA